MIPSRLVRELDRQNVAAVVFAAGNSNQDCAGLASILCINSNEGGLTVAAVDRELRPQDYSSRGPGQCSLMHPFISAPTYGVLPWGNGMRDFGLRGGGTSSVTPQVAGALAVLKGMYPQADNTRLRVALAAGAGQSFSTTTGFGVLRVDRALDEMPFASRAHRLYQVMAQRFNKSPRPVVFAEKVNPSAARP